MYLYFNRIFWNQ